MKPLTKDDIFNFPKTTYGRALGKELANQVVVELLSYKIWEDKLGIPLVALAKLINTNCYFDGKDFHELNLAYINQEGTDGVVIDWKHWENTGEPIYLSDYKTKFTCDLHDTFNFEEMKKRGLI